MRMYEALVIINPDNDRCLAKGLAQRNFCTILKGLLLPKVLAECLMTSLEQIKYDSTY